MKITVITPVYNGEDTITQCIESVLNQTYSDVEYIIMDAVSKDKTLEIINGFASKKIKLISKKDKSSCDAINNAISVATGNIVCFLCSDDMYADDQVLEKVAKVFESDQKTSIVYSDIIYVNRTDIRKVERYWKSSPFKLGLYRKGWLVPHTSLFIKRKALLEHGSFNIEFGMAADYELSYRLLEKYRLKSVYIPQILVKMRSGGVSNSSIKNIYRSLKDCYKVLIYHKVKAPILPIIATMFYRLNQIFIPLYVKKSVNVQP